MPSLTTIHTMICEPDGEAKGWTIQLRIGRLALEFTFARFPR